MAHRPFLAALAAVAGGLAAAAPAPAATPALRACANADGFRCGTLPVPLDRTGSVPGTIPLRFAVRGSSRRPILFALSGGPGQPGVALADGFATSLEPLLRRYRLVVLDQRGTGGSGLISCPSVQGLRSLDPISPQRVAACAQRLGRRRAFFTSADTVLDLDALRAALGSPRVALMGISYGTHVALQYARAFPARVDRLVLDSIVGPDGPDPFLLDTYRNLPRILREQCAGRRCAGITADPVADVASLVARLKAGTVRARAYDGRGRPHQVTFRTGEEAVAMLIEGDLNPFLQAALPAAFAAARAGDDAPLARLRPVATGARTRAKDLSFGLNVTTGCLDGGPPYPLSTPLSARAPAALAALAAVPPSDYAPFDATTLFRGGYGDDCLLWPQDTPRPPFTGPLPDVPALLLGGGADLRTPVENAVATQKLLPRSTLVRLRGNGHDVLDSDLTGCAARALDRFARGRVVGTPCAGRDNGVAPVPPPPRSLSDFRSAPGVGGDRGRKLFAVLDTIEDARLTALQDILGQVPVRSGGLRGGFMTGRSDSDAVRLSGYRLLRDTPVTGRVGLGSSAPTGTVRVGGRSGGVLTLADNGVVTGTLGGRRVSYRPRAGAASAASAGSGGAAVRRTDGMAYRLAGATPRDARAPAALAGLRR